MLMYINSHAKELIYNLKTCHQISHGHLPGVAYLNQIDYSRNIIPISKLMESSSPVDLSTNKRKKLPLEDFLRQNLDEAPAGNVIEWVNRDVGIFKLLWTHQSSGSFTPEHAKLFRYWAVARGKSPNLSSVELKQSLRMALNKSPSVQKLDKEERNNKYRHYCFTNRNYKNQKQTIHLYQKYDISKRGLQREKCGYKPQSEFKPSSRIHSASTNNTYIPNFESKDYPYHTPYRVHTIDRPSYKNDAWILYSRHEGYLTPHSNFNICSNN